MSQVRLEHGQTSALARVRLGLALAAAALPLAGAAVRAEAQSTVPVNVKFRETLEVGLSQGRLRTGGGEILPAVERVLQAHGSPPVTRLFAALPLARLQALESAARARARRPTPSLASWHRLEVATPGDLPRLLAELNALPEIDTAYSAPAAVQPPGGRGPVGSRRATPDFSSQQTYLGPAPAGMGAIFAGTQPGGDGEGVTLVDIEYQWFLDHEDLQLTGAKLGGGCGSFCADDHGTSVLGMIGGRVNGLGVTGSAPGASLKVLSPIDAATQGYNLPGAIATAAASLGAGDVLLIEQQAVGPNGGDRFVPVEWDPAVFDAIRVVTQAGTVVVEAAGNGGENLDGAEFGARFDRSRFDSDAIIVGAGDRNRVWLDFSNYGSRIDLQGWGCCVVTTGYGDLFGSARSNRYTAQFSGTSSAAAMVAAAVAAVQGYLKAGHRTPLGADDLTELLRNTGSAQSGATSRQIGPLPDLRAALIRLGAVPQHSTLTVQGAGNGAGTVTSAPSGIDCALAASGASGSCGNSFESGTSVTLTAAAAEGSTFTEWTGACGGTGTCQVAMTQATTVTAVFTLKSYPLRVAAAGTGSGSVASQAGLTPGIACTAAAGQTGGTCNGTYPHGTVVTLTPTASDDSRFESWSGACGGTADCPVTVTQARSVTARFTLRSHQLTVAGNGSGTGTIATPPGISPALECRVAGGVTAGVCVGSYPSGVVVPVTASPGAGSSFSGWSGACSGTDDCQVTMDQAKTLSAAFTLQPLSLTVAGAGAGSGTVVSAPAGIECGLTAGAAEGACSAAYPAGTEVRLTAAASAGSIFTGWSGGCGGTGPCVVAVGEAGTVTATFALEERALSLGGAGDGSGAVVSTPAGIDCTITAGAIPAPCTAVFAHGAVVSLAAVPAAGSAFAGWSGACSGTGSCSVTMDQTRSVTAGFSRTAAVLTIAGGGVGSGTVATEPGQAPVLQCVVTGGVAGETGCRGEFAIGSSVGLTAGAAPGSLFAGWSGAKVACPAGPICTVAIEGETSVVVRFIAEPEARVAAGDLLGSPHLTPEQKAGLDLAGNRNGRFDVGDYLAMLDREELRR